MLPFEFLIKRRPVSLQTGNRLRLQEWKDFVKSEAQKQWTSTLIENGYLQVSIVYLCDDSPPDVDNIIKPILDALVGLVFVDDILVADVESHRRYLSEDIDVTNLPLLLQNAVFDGEECVYVKVENSKSLESYL